MKKSFAIPLLCCAALMLSGCPGGGGGAGGGSGTPTPSPPSSPAPTPAPSGAVASYVDGAIPGVTAGDGVTQLFATNAGLYMLVWPSDDTKRSRVLKMQGRPDQSQSWIASTPDDDADSLVTSYAPVNVYSEQTREISYYWISSSAARPKFNRWGAYTANSGGISISAYDGTDTSLGRYLELVAAGGINGTVTPRSWLITRRAGANGPWGVYQDDGAYTAANTIVDRFSKAATPDLPEYDWTLHYGGPTIAKSDPNNPRLYVAYVDHLYAYDADSRLLDFQMPASSSGFSDLLFSAGVLYVGYGTTIYRLDGTTLRGVTTIPDLAAFGGLPGRFCISSGRIYFTDGTAHNISTGTKSNWISSGSLTPNQQTQATTLSSQMSMGIYCSPENPGTIYAVVPTATGSLQIRAINPL